MGPTIIAHGGAGDKSTDEKNQEVLEEAVEEGYELMQDGGSALDAVEHVVSRLEDSGLFNAGKGAKLQFDGVPRMEAAIMDDEKRVGAITDLESVPDAVSVAREVMDRTHHCMLSGDAAMGFALELGYHQQDCVSQDRIDAWEEVRAEVSGLDFEDRIERLKELDEGGTVGCVARDADGRMAAATSTGGVSAQLAGRVGDVPMPGCGTYCNDTAAVSATGIGEAIIRTTLSRRCTEYIEDGASADEAAERAIGFLEDETGRHAGVIVIDAEGRAGSDHNAQEMRTASRGT